MQTTTQQMQEKEMVNDILSMAKASMASYARAISECSNQNLRQTFQQMRDGDEKFQYQLYQVAEQKGYYNPAPTADDQVINQIKSQLQQGMSDITSPMGMR